MSLTPKLSLSTWDPGNPQPDELYNDFLSTADGLVPTPVVADKDLNTPPGSPALGVLYIIGPSPTGQWADHAGQLVVYTYENAWKFIVPRAGWLVYVLDETANYRYSGTAWALESSGGGSGVPSVNGITGPVTIANGANTTVTTSGNTITIASSGGSSGTDSPSVAQGFVDPTKADNDLIIRSSASVTSTAIGFIGDSITAGTVVTTAPPTPTVAALTRGAVTATASNQGVSGATSAMWVPGASAGYLATAKAAFASAGVRLVHIMLGTNDSKTAVATTQDQYRANLLAICGDLIASGYIPVVSYPPYLASTTSEFDSASPGRVATYLNAVDSLVDGGHIFHGDTAGYQYFQDNPSALQSDGVHPTQAGSDYLASLWANSLGHLVNAITNRVVLQRLVLGSGLSISTVSGVKTLSSSGAGLAPNRTDLTATGGETQISTTTPWSAGSLQVYKDGLLLPLAGYTTLGKTITLSSAAVSGEIYTVMYAPTLAGSGDSVWGAAEAPSFRYWRAYITGKDSGNDGFMGLQELEMRDVVGGTDITVSGGPSFASSDYAGVNGALAFDRNLVDATNHAWSTASGSAVTPSWVGYDFGAPTQIGEFAMYPPSYGAPYFTTRSPTAFTIQGSDDNSTWVNVKSYSGITGWAVGTAKTFSTI